MPDVTVDLGAAHILSGNTTDQATMPGNIQSELWRCDLLKASANRAFDEAQTIYPQLKVQSANHWANPPNISTYEGTIFILQMIGHKLELNSHSEITMKLLSQTHKFYNVRNAI